jgi:hypothetical protein
MMPKTFIDSAEIAQILELDNTAQFTTRRDYLIEQHAFPRPLPGWKRPMKWRRDDVINWINFAGRNLPNGLPALNSQQSAQVINFANAAAI